MQVERPQYGGQGLAPMARVRSGVELTPDQAGAARWRQVQQLAQAGQHLGQSVLAEAQKRKERDDDTLAQKRLTNERLQYNELSKAIYDKKGAAAIDAPEEAAALLEKLRKNASKDLTLEQQRKFDRAWQAFAPQAQRDALRHKQTQMDWEAEQTDKAKLQGFTEDAKTKGSRGGGLAAVLDGGYPNLIREQTKKMLNGYPPQAQELAARENVRNFHLEQVKNFAAQSPEAALAYLKASGAEKDLDAAEYKDLHDKYLSGQLDNEKEIKLQRSTQKMIAIARRGESTAEAYAALVDEVGVKIASEAAAKYGVFENLAKEDAAKLVKQEEDEKATAKVEGKKKATEAGRAASKTMSHAEAREAAHRDFEGDDVKAFLDAYEGDRKAAKEDVSEAEAEATKAEKQAEKAEKQTEKEASAAGRKAAGDESYEAVRKKAYEGFPEKQAKVMLDAWEEETRAGAHTWGIEQAARGKSADDVDLGELQIEADKKFGPKLGAEAFSAAKAQYDVRRNEEAKQVQLAEEKRWDEFDKTGKIPEGVSRKTRDEMTKKLGNKALGIPGEDPWAFGQHLMDTCTPEGIRQMQRDGKWPEVFARLCPDGKQNDIYRDVTAYMNGEKGRMTPEKYARMQFIAITGIRPGSAKGAQEFNQFMGLFTDAVEQRAAELEIGTDKLIKDEQDKIIANLLEVGDYGYSWQPNFLSSDKYRFQVMGDNDYQDYFYPKPVEKQPSLRATARAVSDTAAAAAPYTGTAAGPRDTAVATPGGVEITTNEGVKQQVADGKVKTRHPKPVTYPEPAKPPRAKQYEAQGATVQWLADANQWEVELKGGGGKVFLNPKGWPVKTQFFGPEVVEGAK